jgi:hypothetical protein
MTYRSSSPGLQRLRHRDDEVSGPVQIVAAFMGLLVEQSVRKLDIGQIAAAGDVSLKQLRAELDSTIEAAAAHVEQLDRLALVTEDAAIVERDWGLAMLLSTVLRTWLNCKDPDLTRAVAALDRAGAWAAPRGFRAELDNIPAAPSPE